MRKTQSGFTLIEVFMVMVIVAMILTLGFPLYSQFKAKAQSAVCIGNLRLLHTGFSNYIQDHDMCWPQKPDDAGAQEEDTWKWWYKTLKPYDVSKKTWVCPSDKENKTDITSDDGGFIGSYIVTEFDEYPNTAYRWNQPWLIERGTNHGQMEGPGMAMPDGSIQHGIPLSQR